MGRCTDTHLSGTFSFLVGLVWCGVLQHSSFLQLHCCLLGVSVFLPLQNRAGDPAEQRPGARSNCTLKDPDEKDSVKCHFSVYSQVSSLLFTADDKVTSEQGFICSTKKTSLELECLRQSDREFICCTFTVYFSYK